VTRERRSAAVLASSSILFLALLGRRIVSTGPIGWTAPRTVVSNGPFGQRSAEPFLLFLRSVRPLLRAGTRVAVIGPGARSGASSLDDLIAIGQLPRNDVVPARAAVERRIPPPEYLAVHLWDGSDDRYRIVAVLESGRLYELRR
jgi:hypothetical protein